MINQNLFDSKKIILKDFLTQLTPRNLWTTWTFTSILALFTFFWFVLIWRYNLDLYEVSYNYSGVERLLTGGTVRSLAIEGGQWWRIFTYGAATVGYGVFLNIIFTGCLVIIFFRLLKFNEGISGSLKTFFAFIIAYIFTGFVLSVLGGPFIYGGLNILVAINMGIMVGTINGHKNQVFDFARYKLTPPLALLLMMPLFTTSGDWISSGFGFVIGMSIMNLFYFKTHRSQISLIFSVGVSLVLFALSLAFALSPLPYGLAIDYVVCQALLLQSHYNLGLTHEQMNNIFSRLNWPPLLLPKVEAFLNQLLTLINF